jgi:hypothetical protein
MGQVYALSPTCASVDRAAGGSNLWRLRSSLFGKRLRLPLLFAPLFGVAGGAEHHGLGGLTCPLFIELDF